MFVKALRTFLVDPMRGAKAFPPFSFPFFSSFPFSSLLFSFPFSSLFFSFFSPEERMRMIDWMKFLVRMCWSYEK